MTTEAQQRIIDIAKDLPDEYEEQVISFMVTLNPENKLNDVSKRIGVAKGKFRAPEDFDANNEEIYAMAMESASKL